MINISNLSKMHGSFKALNDITFSFQKGKTYGIVGENGAGKTTLFKCITGLEDYSGQITSNGEDLKNQIGYLLTESFFFSKITGEEYICLHL